jgi:hypothetical protein
MITITMRIGDNEITRNYDEAIFASTDMERIGSEVWSMWETLSVPYNGEFDEDNIGKQKELTADQAEYMRDEMIENEVNDMIAEKHNN